jgi:hypothetical protein
MPRPESWKALLLFIVILLLASHWVHLGADPPSRLALIAGQDRSADLYADEGLDSSGAIASVRYGHWYLPHQFNLAVDAPLWSAMLSPVFHLAGVNLLVARSLQIVFFCASLWLFYLLLAELEPDSKLLSLLCLLILSSSYLAFCNRSGPSYFLRPCCWLSAPAGRKASCSHLAQGFASRLPPQPS